jgi:hypothetical protein
LADALVIAMAGVYDDPMYTSYRNGYLLDQRVEDLLKAYGVDLSNGGVTSGVSGSPFRLTIIFMTD